MTSKAQILCAAAFLAVMSVKSVHADSNYLLTSNYDAARKYISLVENYTLQVRTELDRVQSEYNADIDGLSLTATGKVKEVDSRTRVTKIMKDCDVGNMYKLQDNLKVSGSAIKRCINERVKRRLNQTYELYKRVQSEVDLLSLAIQQAQRCRSPGFHKKMSSQRLCADPYEKRAANKVAIIEKRLKKISDGGKVETIEADFDGCARESGYFVKLEELMDGIEKVGKCFDEKLKV